MMIILFGFSVGAYKSIKSNLPYGSIFHEEDCTEEKVIMFHSLKYHNPEIVKENMQ